MKIKELQEAIKGWKHASSDLAKWRAAKKAAGQTVKLVSLKKDGNESKMHDATKTFDTEAQAREYHDRIVSLNPGKTIRHHLYVDDKPPEILTETSTGGGTSSGAIASVAHPLGSVNRRPSLFGYVPEDAPAPKRKNIFQVGDQVTSRWGSDSRPATITKIDGDFIHTDEQSYFNKPNSFFHHENYVLHKRRQDV